MTGAARVTRAVLFTTLAAGSYVACALVGVLVVGFAELLVFPDPCLPFCIAADTRGGGAESAGSNIVIGSAVLAYLAALLPMRRRWGRASALAVPLLAVLVIAPAAVAGLITIDAFTADTEVVTCNC